ncbi:MAG: pseudouridine synthase [Ignavibacteriota bacterium]
MTKSSPTSRKSSPRSTTAGPRKKLTLSPSTSAPTRERARPSSSGRPSGGGFRGRSSEGRGAPRSGGRPSTGGFRGRDSERSAPRSGPRKKIEIPGLDSAPVRRATGPSRDRDSIRGRSTGVKSRPPSRSHPSRPSSARPERSGERPALRKRPGSASPTIKPALKNKVVTAAKPAKDTVRLNRFIASAGIAARRKADELITRGKVTVNGKVVKELGVQVDPNKDHVTVDGKTISMKTKFVYLLLNKPKDAISTVKDETDRNTVMNYVNTQERVYPVGRLDRNTTGVLFLTNDGDLTARLTHPKYSVEREYHVTLDKALKKDDAQKIAEGGVNLGEGDISSPVHLAYAHNDPKDVYLSIREGKYHEVRRLFEAFQYDVRKLDRTMFAGITHRGMKRGESRVLTPREIRSLKGLVGLDVGEKFEF